MKAERLRVFKNETSAVPLQVRAGGLRWLALTSVTFEGRPGLEGGINEIGSGSSELVLRPSFAGRSEGLRVTLRAGDLLGLFTKQRTVTFKFVLESLPLALKRPPLPLVISPLSFGENPAGRSGSGQELYAVSEYQPGLDPRDIMWKRAAGMTDETIPIRVREANVRKVVSIGIKVGSRSEDERARRGDMIAEAIAQIGVQLFLIGTTLEITSPSPDGARRVLASDLGELADAASLAWTGDDLDLPMPSAAAGSFDLLITGPEESGITGLAALPRFRYMLVITDGLPPPYLPRGASVFTGLEDLTPVTSAVIAG
ncbi:MAG: hypothetical protein OK474_00630 [Thaumarchaeota archaeon]|nr:hypothetical protein [Nitrososphaerota archaeon]